ncbi:hypothetical protein NY406_05300 [Chlorobaculum sp. MV4-Y]|jgi:hypothetical protein|uniref:hypothetical protein n=1 Tax=Chlorobaculum sp. MV4-Y TaxID=2976335 RepID=UPI0021AF173D|nr:hypothetical protein [Chlorobaculum sp. MV4-Y]UWX58679.1 hypothetical protein NY406_05300 [Chlorobaculum sp. MV4-Y]
MKQKNENSVIRFHYLYRDAGNYKKWNFVDFKNSEGLEIDEIHRRLEKSFDMGCLFNADQVGVPEVFLFDDEEYSLSADDHCFHEYNSVEAVDASREDINLQYCSIGEFVKDVENFSCQGWKVFDPWEKSFSTSIINRSPEHPSS